MLEAVDQPYMCSGKCVGPPLFIQTNEDERTVYVLYIVGTVYDYYFHKQGLGQWNAWTDSITKEESIISASANVS